MTQNTANVGCESCDTDNTVPLKPKYEINCSQCGLRKICVPEGLSEKELNRLESLIQRSKLLKTGDHLFRVGDEFQGLYALRSGCFKTYRTDDEGREHVVGFHFPGELFGFDAIFGNQCHYNAVALDTSSVCRIPFQNLEILSTEMPNLMSQLFFAMSKELVTEQSLMGDYTAEERIAAFLIGLSARFKRRGYSSLDFNLTMSRRDISNYLRLAPETVSRVFAKFQKEKLIDVDRRSVKILQEAEIKRLGRCLEARAK